jgi:hypothetical protein
MRLVFEERDHADERDEQRLVRAIRRIVLHDTTKALLASDRIKKAYLGG